MSDFYNPNRGANWNYGGSNWSLSRGKIDLFTECPRCFFVDNRLGTKRPPGFPFNLNTAVDTLLKKEFDGHRASQTPHPLCVQYGVDAVPFDHPAMDAWRDALKRGVQFNHPATGLLVRGGVDDVWMGADGQLIVVDYKATSKDKKIVALDEDWHSGYKRQMEVYQWLLRQNGFTVSDTGYFVYCNASQDEKAFDGVLKFDITLVPHVGDVSWIEQTLLAIKDCLDSDDIPASSKECDYCRYRNAAGTNMQDHMKKTGGKNLKK